MSNFKFITNDPTVRMSLGQNIFAITEAYFLSIHFPNKSMISS